MRVVLDTNVYISAIISGGMCEKLLERLSQKEGLIFISPFILNEIQEILTRKFGWNRSMIKTVTEDLNEKTVMIKSGLKVDLIKSKKDDNRILECALAANADFLISGDKKHILPLGKINGVQILSPRKFLDVY